MGNARRGGGEAKSAVGLGERGEREAKGLHPRAGRLVPVGEGRLRYFFSGVNYKMRE